MTELSVRDAVHADDVDGWLRRRWGDTRVLAHGRAFEANRLPAYVVTDAAGQLLGLVTYEISPDHLEVGLPRVVLTTTNDNLRALRFYQRHGFCLVALRRGAVAEARRLKPGIPDIGQDGIPIRDELDLELLVDGTDPYPS